MNTPDNDGPNWKRDELLPRALKRSVAEIRETAAATLTHVARLIALLGSQWRVHALRRSAFGAWGDLGRRMSELEVGDEQQRGRIAERQEAFCNLEAAGNSTRRAAIGLEAEEAILGQMELENDAGPPPGAEAEYAAAMVDRDALLAQEQRAAWFRDALRGAHRAHHLRVIVGYLAVCMLFVGVGRAFQRAGGTTTAHVKSESSGDALSLTIEDIVAQAEPSVALIKGRLSTGTGFLVAPNVIVTNKHVIEHEMIESLKLHFPSGTADDRGPFPVSLLYEDESRDLAVLGVKGNCTLGPLKLAHDYQFRRGQEVIVIGNPGLGDDVTLKNAISKGVMSTEVNLSGQEYYQLGISINPGNSGGPVLDPRGRVVAVVTLKASEREGLGFGIPLAQLQETITNSQGSTNDMIAVGESKHRARVVLLLLCKIGSAYTGGMEVYTDAMKSALLSHVSANIGLEVVKEKVQNMLTAYGAALLGDLKKDTAIVCTDRKLPENVLGKFAELWANYLEMKSYIENPRGDFDSYKKKCDELSDRHRRLSESLKLLLGIANKGDY